MKKIVISKSAFLKINVIAIIIFGIFSSKLNFNACLMGWKPDFNQFIASVIYIIIWFACSFLMGLKKVKSYLKFIALFFGIGAAILFVFGYCFDVFLIAIIPALILSTPLYGLRYLLNMPSDMIFAIITILITFVSALIGYLLGKKVSGLVSSK